MLLASGLWWGWYNHQRHAPPAQVADGNHKVVLQGETAKNGEQIEQRVTEAPEIARAPQLQEPRPDMQKRVPILKRRVKMNNGYSGEGLSSSQSVAVKTLRRDLHPSKAIEGEEAKEQIMLALRVASAKLNLAQRMTQGSAPSVGRIRRTKSG